VLLSRFLHIFWKKQAQLVKRVRGLTIQQTAQKLHECFRVIHDNLSIYWKRTSLWLFWGDDNQFRDALPRKV